MVVTHNARDTNAARLARESTSNCTNIRPDDSAGCLYVRTSLHVRQSTCTCVWQVTNIQCT